MPSGLRLGDGVYETIRTYGGEPFLLGEHLERMLAGAGALELPEPPSRPKIEKAVAAALRAARASKGRDLAVRIILRSSGDATELLVLADPLAPVPAKHYAKGIRASIARGIGFPSLAAGPPGRLKWLSHGPNVLAFRRARKAGFDEALLGDHQGRLVEGSRSNLFAVVSGTLVAPGPESGALDGVTRAVVLESARGRGLHVEERALSEEELRKASEAFLTSSLLEVAPLVDVDGRKIGAGVPGVLARRLRESYADRVRKECGAC
jgi:branched-subunit amino acid aminotransferase/4-amino-4-deoxychorismate lyase